MFKRPVSWTTVLCLLVLVAMAASTLTLSIVGANAPTAQPQQDGRFARLEEIFALVEGVYYTPVDEEALLTGAVRGMLAALEDPYTFYYTPEEYAAMNEETVGLYSGVGMLLGLDGEGGLAVMRVFRDSPAERAGVQAGDRVLAIEGTSVEGGTAKDLATATSLTRGRRRPGSDPGDPARPGAAFDRGRARRGQHQLRRIQHSRRPDRLSFDLPVHRKRRLRRGGGDLGLPGGGRARPGGGRALQPRRAARRRGGHLRPAPAGGAVGLHRGSPGAARGVLRRRRLLGCAHGGAGQRHVGKRLGDLRRRRAGERPRRDRGREHLWQGRGADALLLC